MWLARMIMKRFVLLVLLLALVVLIPFLVWGDGMERAWTMTRLEGFGHWAWLVGWALLVGDLLLPMPSTVVMSGLGYVYGVWLGGLLAAMGAFGSAMVGYGVCRILGETAMRRLLGSDGLAEGRRLFEKGGPWVVALSRCLPILAEVVACLAGMTRMPWTRFAWAAACGCVPLGFVYAAVGAWGWEQPFLALVISVGAPPVLWLVMKRWLDASM